MSWKFYYDDETFFSSKEGSPAEAPALGIILLWQTNDDDDHHPVEKHLGLDWYWWRSDLNRWLSGDLHGYLDQAMNLGASYPKMGRVMRDKHYYEIVNIANRDPEYWNDPNET